MAEFSLDTKVIDETLVASISRILTRKKIPCVLWGNYLLTVYGVPTIVDVRSPLLSFLEVIADIT